MDFNQTEVIAAKAISPGTEAYANYILDPTAPYNITFVGGTNVEILHYLRDALNFRVVAMLTSPITVFQDTETEQHKLGGSAISLNEGISELDIGSIVMQLKRITGPDALNFLHTFSSPK